MYAGTTKALADQSLAVMDALFAPFVMKLLFQGN